MKDVWFKNIKYFTGNDCWRKICALRYNSKAELKSCKRLLSEIKYYLTKYRINRFEFVDFCNLNLEELDKFCRAIVQKKISIEWSAPVIINPGIKPDSIERMKQAGCRKVIIELFSASDNLLNKIGAIFTTRDVLSVLKSYRQAGIDVGINLVFGHPLEEQLDRDKTVNFLHENIGLINEITSLISCSEAFALCYPFFGGCCHRERCFGPVKSSRLLVSAKDFNSFVSKINDLNKPIACIYPPKTIFDEFERYTLRNKNLCFYFNNGKGSIFSKGLRITSGFGLYVSIFADSSWQDSEHADWQVSKINDKKMILKGKWQLVPLIQTWEIELKEKEIIGIKIEIEFLRQMFIDGEQQVNIMLRDEYNRWSSSNGAKGTTPSSFDHSWPTLFEESNKVVNTIKIETGAQGVLPQVSLCDKAQKEGYRMAVLNTSTVFNARVLKCYKADNKRYFPGKYLYFDGEIKINN